MPPLWINTPIYMQTIDIQIRQVRAADLPLLEWNGELSHYRQLFRQVFEQSQRRRTLMWFVSSPEYPIIGQVFVQLISTRLELADGFYRAHVFSFRVIPELRSQGIGGILLRKVEQDLLHRGFHRACLNVVRTNLRGRAFYARHGYEVIGEDPGIWSYQDLDGVWHNMEEPAWRMEKPLVLP